MQTLLRITVLTLVLCCSVLTIQAQKYGHLNLGNLLEQMPEMEAAEKELTTYQEQLMTKGQKMLTDFQTKVQTLEQTIQELAPVVLEERKKALQQEEQEIMKYEQEVRIRIQQKREELLSPLLKRVQDAINAIAESENYVMIFDTSIYNAILFAEASEDIMEKVKAKL